MKTFRNKFLLTASLFLLSSLLWADPPEPGPPVPPPVGLSIDENSMILIIIALLFGIYIIYKNRVKTKTPI
jgi:hypothetical protein